MTDLSQTIAPKSDQLNADDLIGRPMTITVSRVSRMSEPDQPIAINFEGDGGKPYKPCKSMRRVLVTVWGNDGTSYVGRRMTLYRDDKVQFGGMAVGGIRISHMSDIAKEQTMALTVTRAKRQAYTVRPLAAERGQPQGNGSGGGNRAQPASGTGQGQSSRDRLYAAARAEAEKGSDALRAFRDGLQEAADRALQAIQAELDEITARADDADDLGFPGDEALSKLQQGEAA